MTQTIRKIKDNNTIDIYYHPNNPSPSKNDPKLRYKYSARLEHIDAAEALEWLTEALEYEEEEEARATLIKELNSILPKINKGKIWVIYLEKDEQEIDQYHATKQDAIDYCMMNLYV